MDRIDIRILGQLSRGVSSLDRQSEVRGIYGRVADKLALDEDTVRKRVERLESKGIIRGWQLVVNPSALGLKRYIISVRLSPNLTVEEATRKIRLVEGVTSIAREVGDVLLVGILCENDQSFRKRIELVSELTGTRDMTNYAVRYPYNEFEPTFTDWQIIKTIKPDPLLPCTAVAEKLGLSSRTVRRRLARLAQGSVIFYRLNIDFTLFEGCTCVDFLVSYTSSGYKQRIDRTVFAKYEDYVLRAGWGSESHGFFEFVLPNAHLAQEIADWTRSLRGVRDVRLNFRDNRLHFDEALDEIVANKARRAPILQVA